MKPQWEEYHEEITKAHVKSEEGYREDTYKCTEGHLTGGYGHKMLDGEVAPTTREGWEAIFNKDFNTAKIGATELVGITIVPALGEPARPVRPRIATVAVVDHRVLRLPVRLPAYHSACRSDNCSSQPHCRSLEPSQLAIIQICTFSHEIQLQKTVHATR